MTNAQHLVLDFFSLAVMELQESNQDAAVRRVLGMFESRLDRLPKRSEEEDILLARVLAHWMMYWESKQDWAKVVEVGSRAIALKVGSTAGWVNTAVAYTRALDRLDRLDEALPPVAEGVEFLIKAYAHPHDFGEVLVEMKRFIQPDVSAENTPVLRDLLRRIADHAKYPPEKSECFVEEADYHSWITELILLLYPRALERDEPGEK